MNKIQSLLRLFSASVLGLIFVTSPVIAASTLSVPTLNMPSNGSNSLPVFSWDNVAGAKSYDIQVSKNIDFNDCLSSSCFAEKKGIKQLQYSGFTKPFWEAKTYYWRVRANASKAIETSEWSTPRELNIGNQVHKNIAAVASNYTNGQASPQSITGDWGDDLDPPQTPSGASADGKYIKDAINVYMILNCPECNISNVADVLKPSGYKKSSDRMAIAKRIGDVLPLSMLVKAPDSDDELLAFLGIRAQCKELADRVVLEGGGTRHPYSNSVGVELANIRPGMYAFLGSSHAAIVNAIQLNSSGAVTKIRLTESNWGKGWANPSGQVPWSRTIGTTRVVSASGFKIVDTSL